jgi:hypothetical protein
VIHWWSNRAHRAKATEGHCHLLSLLKTPSLRRFFLAHLQSELGTGAAYVALLLVAYHRLHSGWAISLVLLADFVRSADALPALAETA